MPALRRRSCPLSSEHNAKTIIKRSKIISAIVVDIVGELGGGEGPKEINHNFLFRIYVEKFTRLWVGVTESLPCGRDNYP